MSGDRAAPSPSQQAAAPTIFGINSSVAVTLVLISPIIFTLVVYPDSFNLSWNEGRGGFIFAMAFIAAELVGVRQPVSKRKFLVVAGLAALTIGYFAALPYGLHDSIRDTGLSYGIRSEVIGSWMFMWDFVVMALFVGASLVVLFGKKWYKIAPAGAIYLAGSAVILSLDAFFPYDTLGPLQIIVPAYLQIDQAVIRFIDTNIMDIGKGVVATARGNLLVLNGLHGPFALQVFWPSAGVHSMIIYTLVMLAFLLKMEIPLKRKLIYFAIGTLGTVAVNVVRIISLTMYALIVTANPREWEAFHSVAGEIMFLPWLGIYLGIVMYTEGRRLRRMRQQQASTTPSSTSP
ncbi:exosortase/archaeosortase family protein [Candidatus Nitrososphaera evergladensis SR1]|uniref:Exosortase/archaeosortase family protein n=1 Tax=Candidatus Nitrososphaera evergladensis SR1 TaxID=1459636 RepID=A0A075MSG9_9ARCH|nr:thaumarchaeosortase [Candidatus Nitrososphaera evergladensis]AIF83737.1 exosortase/archaeosortase family protein [Candidatus Nitrososphaera evergladensis SR1]